MNSSPAHGFLDYGFAIDGLLAGTLVGVMCGVVGVYMALQRLALIGDATGHAALPGVCAAFLLTGSKSVPVLLVGALASGALGNAAISWLETRPRTRPDASIGVVLSVAFGIGVVLLGAAQASPTGAQSGLNSFLFGSVAAVSRGQLVALGVSAAVVISTIGFLRRGLTLAVFDRDYAESIGLSTVRYRAGMLFILAVAVVLSINTVGVVLVSAMLIIPPSTALLATHRIDACLLLSGVLGGACGAIGAYASFHYAGLSSGPAMVLVAAAVFGVVLAAVRGTEVRRT